MIKKNSEVIIKARKMEGFHKFDKWAYGATLINQLVVYVRLITNLY